MKKKYFYILLSFFVIFSFNIFDASADCLNTAWSCDSNIIVQRNSGKHYIGEKKKYYYYTYARQLTHNNVYCIRKGATGPTSKVCSLKNDMFGNATRAAIGYIINKYDGNYGKAQYLIHRILELREGGASVGDYSLYQTEYETAARVANDYANSVPGTYYLANLYNCGDGIQPIAEGYTTEEIEQKYNITYNGNGGTYNGSSTWLDNIRGPVKYGDSYTTWSNNNFFVRNNYEFIGWNEKADGTGVSWTAWIDVPWTWTYKKDVTLYAQWRKLTGELTIEKVKQDGSKLYNKHVLFKIYNNSNCSGTGTDWSFYSGGTGTDSITLNAGYHYSVEEITPPDGYGLPVSETDRCTYVGYLNYGGSISATITNKTQCEFDFENDSSIKNRLVLYKKYGFNNLLNFNENDSTKACTSVTPNYNKKNACLKADMVDSAVDFDNMNLSNYNDEITGNNNSKAYCLTDFELDSNVEIKDNISAGQMVYSADKNESAITATLTKTCYVPETEINNYSFETTTTNYYTKDEIVNNFNVLKSYRKNKNFYYKNNLSSYHARKGILVKRNNEIYELVGTNSILNTTNCNYSRRFQDLEGNYICLKHPYNIIPCYNCKYNYFDILYNYKEKKFYLVQQSQLHTQFTQIEDIYVKNTDRVLNTSVNDFYSNYLNYEDYITNIYLNNNIINLKEILESPVVMEDAGYFKKITGVLTANYTLNPVYAYKMSGNTPEDNSECYNEETGILDYKCSLIGYGVMSKFKDGDKTDVTSKSAFNFKIDNSSAKKPIEKKFEFIDNKCEYTVNPEIIKYENTENGNLELEFRSIDKNEPFSNRETNSNWCDEENCASNNNTVQSVIKGRNDSYNSTQAGALYTTETDSAKIILTPDIIKKIRDYSSGTGDYAGNPHPYDNYELVCDINGTNCRNAFLEEFEIIRIP